MNEADQTERTNRRWVLFEKVKIENNKEGLRFVEIAPGSETVEGGKERIFSAKAFRLAYVGNVYTIDASENQCWPDTLRFVSKWHDEQRVADWQAKARAFDVQRRMVKLAKEAGKTNELLETLAPFRRAYRETDVTGRIALESVLLYFLRYGSISKLADPS
jgi:hypothetical protein